MTFFYTARYSNVLLRPKIRLNSQDKVQESGFVRMGKWAFENFAIYFLRDEKAPDDQIFLL